MIGGALEEERGPKGRRRGDGIEAFGCEAERFVHAVEDFGSEACGERSAGEGQDVRDGGDADLVEGELRRVVDAKCGDWKWGEGCGFVSGGDGRKRERAEASQAPGAREVWRGGDADAEAEFAEASGSGADDARFSFVDDLGAGGIDEGAVGQIGRNQRRKPEKAAGERVESACIAIGAVGLGVERGARRKERAGVCEIHSFGDGACGGEFAAACDELAACDFAGEEDGEGMRISL